MSTSEAKDEAPPYLGDQRRPFNTGYFRRTTVQNLTINAVTTIQKTASHSMRAAPSGPSLTTFCFAPKRVRPRSLPASLEHDPADSTTIRDARR